MADLVNDHKLAKVSSAKILWEVLCDVQGEILDRIFVLENVQCPKQCLTIISSTPVQEAGWLQGSVL